MIHSKTRSLRYLAAILLVFAALRAEVTARAEFPRPREARPTRPYPGVEVTALEFTAPRPLRAWVIQIDLTAPDLDFVVTPRARPKRPYAPAAARTLGLARGAGVQLA